MDDLEGLLPIELEAPANPGEVDIESARLKVARLQKELRAARGNFGEMNRLRDAIRVAEANLEALVRAEAAHIDEEKRRSRTIDARLPDSFIDPILGQPVNIPIPLMGELYVIPPADLELGTGPELTREGFVDVVAQVVERGVRARIFTPDPFSPESRVGAGIIEERVVFPDEGQHFPIGTIFGHLGPGRDRAHPRSHLRLGMVIDDDVLIPDPEGGPDRHGHRIEFYSGVHWVASTRAWKQLQARGVPLIQRQKAWMERHNQLDPAAHIEFLTVSAGATRAGTRIETEEEELARRMARRNPARVGDPPMDEDHFFVEFDVAAAKAAKAAKKTRMTVYRPRRGPAVLEGQMELVAAPAPAATTDLPDIRGSRETAAAAVEWVRQSAASLRWGYAERPAPPGEMGVQEVLTAFFPQPNRTVGTVQLLCTGDRELREYGCRVAVVGDQRPVRLQIESAQDAILVRSLMDRERRALERPVRSAREVGVGLGV